MIKFSSVTKQFLPDSFAIKDVSFDISPGELVVLTGPSGSGKTTIMKLLTKEYQPNSGTVIFHDVDLSTIKNSQIHNHRRKIGVVFQDYKLIPELNVWENIALPLSIIGKKEHEIEQRVTDLLELVSLTQKALHFPKQLSGGEAQRISIARALSTGPSVVFADEPTGNLDKDNSIQIAKLLKKINSLGTTILFATHDHDVIDLFSDQRHIILNNGEIEKDSLTPSSKKTEKNKQTQDKSESQSEPKKIEESEDEKIPEIKPKSNYNFFSRFFGLKRKTEKQLSNKKIEEDRSPKEDQKSEKDVNIIEVEKKEKKSKKKVNKKT